MSGYESKFTDAIASYPFGRWQQSGMEQYTPEACAEFAAIFDRLIAALVRDGESATEQVKLEHLRTAIKELNTLNEQDESLIETGEREDLCALVNLITTACGMDPSKYGDGEGPASEWREW
jgi:hypothetical protein